MNNNKNLIFVIFFCIFLKLIPSLLNAEEIDKGLLIIDKDPWKISWVKEDKDWILIANFDKGIIKTYFKKEPPIKGFGLSPDNEPTKQEFEFYFGQKLNSTTYQYERWPDGAKCYSFLYEQQFTRDGQRYELGATAIIEKEQNVQNEIRYSIFRKHN